MVTTRLLFGVLGGQITSRPLIRAMIACENSSHIIADDFPEVRKIVSSGATSKPVKDYELTRYACYLIVQNGDPLIEKLCIYSFSDSNQKLKKRSNN